MKTHETHSTIRAIIALLCLLIVAAFLYKFVGSINYLQNDPAIMQKYVIFFIVGGGFLLGLMYLVSQSLDAKKQKTKVVKAKVVTKLSASKKKKKK